MSKAHLIFQASTFKEGKNKDEVAKWDPRVIVSFQENAWVDARTHIHGLKKILKPVNYLLEGTVMKGVIFKDNLSSHRTDAVLDYFKEELKNFVSPRFIPADMTLVIQVIDCHIGVQHKRAVYIKMIKIIMKRVNAVREAVDGDMTVIVEPLKPK